MNATGLPFFLCTREGWIPRWAIGLLNSHVCPASSVKANIEQLKVSEYRPSIFIPYMSPTGGGYSEEFQRANPAWDHRFLLKGLQPGERVTIRQRVCYMPYKSDADILQEYEKWLEERRH